MNPWLEKGKDLLDKILHPTKHKEEKARRASASSVEGSTGSSSASKASAEHPEEQAKSSSAGGGGEGEVKKFEEYVHKNAAKEAGDNIWGQPGR